MADRLCLQDLAVRCHLGVYDWERKTRQQVLVDVEIQTNFARATREDDPAKALDYAALVALIQTTLTHRRFHLMETAAEAVAERILQEPLAERVTVRVKKRVLKNLGAAVAEVTRWKHP